MDSCRHLGVMSPPKKSVSNPLAGRRVLGTVEPEVLGEIEERLDIERKICGKVLPVIGCKILKPQPSPHQHFPDVARTARVHKTDRARTAQ